MPATKSLPRLYLGALLASRRRVGRATRFDAWQAGPYRVTLDRELYRRYANRIGLKDDGQLLPSWFYVLSQRAVLDALADPRFPYPATGMVHLRNRIEVAQTPAWGTPLTLTLDLAYGELNSAGHRIDLVARFHDGDALIATNPMSAMVRCPAEERGPRRPERQPEAFGEKVTFDYGADAGRRYARVCDDYNPIHLWPWSARLFGFERPIAHGMYSIGRIAALFAGRDIGVDQQLDATFLKPLFLPSSATLGYERDGADTRFELVSEDGRVLLHGVAR